jgi:hypothetical protein
MEGGFVFVAVLVFVPGLHKHAFQLPALALMIGRAHWHSLVACTCRRSQFDGDSTLNGRFDNCPLKIILDNR